MFQKNFAADIGTGYGTRFRGCLCLEAACLDPVWTLISVDTVHQSAYQLERQSVYQSVDQSVYRSVYQSNNYFRNLLMGYSFIISQLHLTISGCHSELLILQHDICYKVSDRSEAPSNKQRTRNHSFELCKHRPAIILEKLTIHILQKPPVLKCALCHRHTTVIISMLRSDGSKLGQHPYTTWDS